MQDEWNLSPPALLLTASGYIIHLLNTLGVITD